MVKVYADLMRKGAICPKTGEPYTLEDVPERIREAVRRELEGE